MTYAQVETHASALAASLAELGVGAGDRIAINLPNRPEWDVSFVAAAKLGALVVPVNPSLAYHELEYLLRHAEVSCVVTVERWEEQDFLDTFEKLFAELPDLQYLVTVGKEDLSYDARIFRFEDLVSDGEGRPVPPTELALLYASGTMGKPNGVRLSHRAVAKTALPGRVRSWCDVRVAYGLTETGPTVAITRFGDPEEKRLTTVGRPLRSTDVRIVDPGTRATLPAGAEGEIAVRGPGVMSGYARMPACVVPVEGAAVPAEELRDFARDTMADYKIPDFVRFFDAFPITGTGKPKRRDLEQMVALEATVRVE